MMHGASPVSAQNLPDEEISDTQQWLPSNPSPAAEEQPAPPHTPHSSEQQMKPSPPEDRTPAMPLPQPVA